MQIKKTVVKKTEKIESGLKNKFDEIKNANKPRIPFTSKLAGLTLAKRNKLFAKLSECDQTREVALDALSLLFTPEVQANPQGYWDERLFKRAKGNIGKLQKNFQTIDETCNVCQRGLWMLAETRVTDVGNYVNDDSTLSDMSQGYSTDWGNSTQISKMFNKQALIDMELEYELSYHDAPYKSHTKNKMANNICNILNNCGFDETDKTDYLKLWNINLENVTGNEPAAGLSNGFHGSDAQYTTVDNTIFDGKIDIIRNE